MEDRVQAMLRLDLATVRVRRADALMVVAVTVGPVVVVVEGQADVEGWWRRMWRGRGLRWRFVVESVRPELLSDGFCFAELVSLFIGILRTHETPIAAF